MKKIFKFFNFILISLLTSCDMQVKVEDIFKLNFDNQKEIESLFNDKNYDKNIFKEDLIDLTKDINELTIYKSLEYAKVHYTFYSNFYANAMAPYPTISEIYVYVDKVNDYGIVEFFTIFDSSERAGILTYNGVYNKSFTKAEKEKDYNQTTVLRINFKIVDGKFSKDERIETYSGTYYDNRDNEIRLNLTYISSITFPSFNINRVLTDYNISDIKINSLDGSYRVTSNSENLNFRSIYDRDFKENYSYFNGDYQPYGEDYDFTFFIAREYEKNDYIIEDINFDSHLSFYTSNYFPKFSSEILFN